MFKIKFPTKRIFRIFYILRIIGMAPFCNLFMERPSYICIIFSSSSVYSECRCHAEQIVALLVITCSIVVTDVPDLVCAVQLFSGCCYLYEFCITAVCAKCLMMGFWCCLYVFVESFTF